MVVVVKDSEGGRKMIKILGNGKISQRGFFPAQWRKHWSEANMGELPLLGV